MTGRHSIASHNARRPLQRIMVRVKQRQRIAPVELAIGHHLINVGLRDALLRVVDARRHPFPLRIDGMDNPAAALEENIGLGLEQAPPILYCLQAEQPPALQMDTEAASSQRPAHHAADVLLEQGVHFEQQGKASLRARRRGLEPVAKEELREGEQILPTGIGSVELDIFPAQRAHRNRGHIGVAERQFR